MSLPHTPNLTKTFVSSSACAQSSYSQYYCSDSSSTSSAAPRIGNGIPRERQGATRHKIMIIKKPDVFTQCNSRKTRQILILFTIALHTRNLTKTLVSSSACAQSSYAQCDSSYSSSSTSSAAPRIGNGIPRERQGATRSDTLEAATWHVKAKFVHTVPRVERVF